MSGKSMQQVYELQMFMTAQLFFFGHVFGIAAADIYKVISL